MLHHILCIRVSTPLKNNSPSLLKPPLNLQTVQAFGHTGMLILILIDVQYSQLFLALKKARIVKILPPQVPFGKKIPPLPKKKKLLISPSLREISPHPLLQVWKP